MEMGVALWFLRPEAGDSVKERSRRERVVVERRCGDLGELEGAGGMLTALRYAVEMSESILT